MERSPYCAGLGGELRPANHIERRIMEAAKLGFSHIIVPAIHAPAATGRLANIDIIKCKTIKEALMVGPPFQKNPMQSVPCTGVFSHPA